jgi:hypothetical protein
LKTCIAESGTEIPLIVTGVPTIAAVPEQADPLKYSYVTVPVTWNTSVNVAESDTEPPAGIVEADSVVVSEEVLFRNDTEKMVE